MRRSVDRARIETFLAIEMASIEEWCRWRGIALDAWPHQRAARGWLELAISRAVTHAQRTGLAGSRTAAMRLVCARFGIANGDAVRRRLEREQQNWRQNCRSLRDSAA